MAKRKFPEALKVTLAFVITAVLLVVFMLLAANIGGIKVTFSQMFRGLFIEYDEDVAIIVQLRFPRIFVAILGGMAMAAAGVITQAVMKSPLADPGIIGISAGSQFVAVLVTAIADGETMMSVVLRSGVFMGHTEIERVVLGENIVHIGVGAFADCSALTSVEGLENASFGAFTFRGCALTGEITVASTMTEIPTYAFQNCASLTKVDLPAALTSIGASAFSGAGLTEVTIPSSVTAIGASAFFETALTAVTVPASVTSLGASVFSGCTVAQVVDLAGELENLPAAYNTVTDEAESSLITEGDYTFLYVPASGETAASAYLVSYNGTSNMITLPASFTADGQQVTSYEIMAGAFVGAKFTSVIVPAAVTAIGDYAFYCSDLLKITFNDPTTCTRLGEYSFAGSTLMFFNSNTAMALDLTGFSEVAGCAFSDTTRLQTVILAASVTSIGERAFQSSAVKSIQFAETRTEALELADFAFAYMYDLESIVIPGYVTELPASLLRGCSSLTSVTLEEGVEKLNNYVFRDCTSLTSLILPVSLTETISTAFSYSEIEVYYYAGTAEQLAASSIASTAKNSAYTYLEEAPINDGSFWHYVEGVPTIWPMV